VLNPFVVADHTLTWRSGRHILTVQPWGEDSVRVRAGLHRIAADLPGALGAHPPTADPAANRIEIDAADGHAALVNGRIRVQVDATTGLVSFSDNATGDIVVSEAPAHFWWPGSRHFEASEGGLHRIEQRFAAYPDERIYGLGQHGHGRLDQKGMVIELAQRNGEVSIPFVLSSRGYGMLWNNPAVGRVEFAGNGTRWVADRARQIDYWLTVGETPAAIMTAYAGATGFPSTMPEWASGFWQSKLRYRDQAEYLEIAREYARRGLPLSVLVIDYLHWRHLGDWDFNADAWPDPRAMVEELRALGVEPAVSVWPSVSPLSENYLAMREAGMLAETDNGTAAIGNWPDGDTSAEIGVAFYDATDPRARDFLWEKVESSYYKLGIRALWLDACEPEVRPGPQNLNFAAGPGCEVANLYPREHSRGVYEHQRRAGQDAVLSLVRSAWAGSQRYGVALWSGDIPATFPALADSIRAGLNVALSGIPWWNSDIGGFHGGDPEDPEFRELIVRWFQFGVFCPVTRLHGHREPRGSHGPVGDRGGPNEVWSFGETAYEVITPLLHLRERLRPYIHTHLRDGERTGIPLMRPLLLAFPDDPEAWTIEDQYLFGPDILVAPVTEFGARQRRVYLPAGAEWTHTDTGRRHQGGGYITVDAPLASIPLFTRDDAEVPLTD
jgi:alpha-D-xyloside xylohydrolase